MSRQPRLVLTDWAIVRRLAAELDRGLRGKRIDAAGRLADGRFGLHVAGSCVACDAFGPTPLITLENLASLEREAGWVRTAADALVGLRIEAARSRTGDRLVAFECAARSRFGVRAGYRLVVELVPRFGNIVLLKDDTIVAAAKEFPRSSPARRATIVGEPYEPPPLPQRGGARVTLEGALAALRSAGASTPPDDAVHALRDAVPLLPQLLATSVIVAGARRPTVLAPDEAPRALAERCREGAQALVTAISAGAYDGEALFAYRDSTRLVQCHVTALAQYAEFAESREPELLPLLRESVGAAREQRSQAAFEARRATIQRRVEKRRADLAARRSTLERERDDASQRDALRVAGELLYAHLDEVPAGAERFVPPTDPGVTIALDPGLDAKANAAAIFKRYRKATAKLAHTQERLMQLARDEHFLADIAWELERAEPETLDDVAETAARLERPKATAIREPDRRRKPLDVRLSGDARIYVGRSPRGNADLTFRIARPDDLWFHARATPGAHVVLRLDSPRAATDDELRRAASLAAYHSKAGASEKVSVDYTQRKYVRRRQNAPPGLVWYTNAQTMLVTPAIAEKT